MFRSLPLAIRPKVQATEARLDSIYKAASMGLKGDSLALASGMLPVEYRQLCQFDPLAELAAQKGKADNELRAAQRLNEASEQRRRQGQPGNTPTRTRLDGPAGDQCGRLSEDQRHHGA
jgi:hypothetical protein